MSQNSAFFLMGYLDISIMSYFYFYYIKITEGVLEGNTD